MEKNYKYIHLLYVPTMACNMGCKYCYLEDNTKELKTKYKPLDTLEYAVSKFKENNVIPFNEATVDDKFAELLYDTGDFAITTFFSYNSDTTCSVVENSFNSVSYFSNIDNFVILLLFLSFNCFIASSASSNVETYNFSSLFSNTA